MAQLKKHRPEAHDGHETHEWHEDELWRESHERTDWLLKDFLDDFL